MSPATFNAAYNANIALIKELSASFISTAKMAVVKVGQSIPPMPIIVATATTGAIILRSVLPSQWTLSQNLKSLTENRFIHFISAFTALRMAVYSTVPAYYATASVVLFIQTIYWQFKYVQAQRELEESRINTVQGFQPFVPPLQYAPAVPQMPA